MTETAGRQYNAGREEVLLLPPESRAVATGAVAPPEGRAVCQEECTPALRVWRGLGAIDKSEAVAVE